MRECYVLSFWRSVVRSCSSVCVVRLLPAVPDRAVPASFTLGKMGLGSTTTAWCSSTWSTDWVHHTCYFRNYYVSIPDALIKAARLDVRGFFTIFR